MKLTKEECLKALNDIKFLCGINIPINSLEIIENIINEHFDNPPLKFEELEKWQWVWDSKTQNYAKVFDLFIDEKGRKIINIACGMNYFRIQFEEGRFYRKQVHE